MTHTVNLHGLKAGGHVFIEQVNDSVLHGLELFNPTVTETSKLMLSRTF
jgi:hypothetical protein